MTVRERVVFASFTQEVLHHVADLEEGLFNLEVFHLDILGSLNLEVAGDSKQELFVKSSRGGQADVAGDGLDTLVDLLLESHILIINDVEVGVANPGIDELLIECYRFFFGFISSLIVLVSVKFICSIGSCDHMYHSFVPSVPQLDMVPAGLIQQSLPHILVSVGTSVHNSAIAYYDCLLIAVYCNFDEYVL